MKPTPAAQNSRRTELSPAKELPVAIIGAGPIGLATTAHLLARGEQPIVFEAGDAPGATVRSWAHVRMFSPWRYLMDPVAREALEARGWSAPDLGTIPTGEELLQEYLAPLAELAPIAECLRLDHRVVQVARSEADKIRSVNRENAPFDLVIERAGGAERHRAKAVIDASGTFGTPNPIGANGLPAHGEPEVHNQVFYGIPDAVFRHRRRYAGRRTVVVGNGDSALNALLALDALKSDEPDTEVVWAIRGDPVDPAPDGSPDDPLPERAGLRSRGRRLVERGRVELISRFPVHSVRTVGSGILLGDGVREIGPFDEVVAATGSRPDLGMHRELRLELDPRLECPVRLAPLVDPELHTCETVRAHGHDELHHPEPGFYLLGMKSYGRAPGFLLATGYEQVRSVTSALVGDHEGARVEPELHITSGACSSRSSAPDHGHRSPAATVPSTGDGCCG